ncbi:putative photosynthetic complex assembly protein [Rhodoblastus acidophilus]|jgi:putative photosynthetic complex assembly protein|nr:photosynthetic complex assembly protein PuhC [Rhodoblastus acidophilus]MCW2273069.1 putative photosynthetic complex assembly protein [Rhodoblastus acidophilus]
MGETAQVKKGGHHDQNIPRGVLIAAGALIAFALSATYYARTSDVGTVHMPAAQPLQTMLLHFVDQDDGGIVITNASDGAVLVKIAPGANGFVRSMMRGFARARNRSGLGAETPFNLTRWSNGTMSLTDETTGRRIDLDAFGPNQAEFFAGIFPAKKATAP